MKRKDANVADRCSGTRTASCGQSAWTSATPWRTCSQQFRWRSQHPRCTRPFLDHACASIHIHALLCTIMHTKVSSKQWYHLLFSDCSKEDPTPQASKNLDLACRNVSCGSAGGRLPRTRNSADLRIRWCIAQMPQYPEYPRVAKALDISLRPQHGTTWFDLPLFPHLAITVRNEVWSSWIKAQARNPKHWVAHLLLWGGRGL